MIDYILMGVVMVTWTVFFNFAPNYIFGISDISKSRADWYQGALVHARYIIPKRGVFGVGVTWPL